MVGSDPGKSWLVWEKGNAMPIFPAKVTEMDVSRTSKGRRGQPTQSGHALSVQINLPERVLSPHICAHNGKVRLLSYKLTSGPHSFAKYLLAKVKWSLCISRLTCQNGLDYCQIALYKGYNQFIIHPTLGFYLFKTILITSSLITEIERIFFFSCN